MKYGTTLKGTIQIGRGARRTGRADRCQQVSRVDTIPLSSRVALKDPQWIIARIARIASKEQKSKDPGIVYTRIRREALSRREGHVYVQKDRKTDHVQTVDGVRSVFIRDEVSHLEIELAPDCSHVPAVPPINVTHELQEDLRRGHRRRLLDSSERANDLFPVRSRLPGSCGCVQIGSERIRAAEGQPMQSADRTVKTSCVCVLSPSTCGVRVVQVAVREVLRAKRRERAVCRVDEAEPVRAPLGCWGSVCRRGAERAGAEIVLIAQMAVSVHVVGIVPVASCWRPRERPVRRVHRQARALGLTDWPELVAISLLVVVAWPVAHRRFAAPVRLPDPAAGLRRTGVRVRAVEEVSGLAVQLTIDVTGCAAALSRSRGVRAHLRCGEMRHEQHLHHQHVQQRTVALADREDTRGICGLRPHLSRGLQEVLGDEVNAAAMGSYGTLTSRSRDSLSLTAPKA